MINEMPHQMHLSSLFVTSSASPFDAVTVFFNQLLGKNYSQDGYLMYLLIMCGLLIIGLVLIYNWWEEKRFNAQVEKSFSPIKNDALLDQNKKQFLEKFAATTGYLSDAPDAGSFLGNTAKAASDEEKSIDDVYTELLDTMSKRSGSKSASHKNTGVEEDGYEVNSHQNSDFTHQTTVPEHFSLPEEISSEEIIQSVAPAQHHAIKSIIDQVFKNKGFVSKPNIPDRQEMPYDAVAESALNPVPKLNPGSDKEESVLDAYLMAKNAIEENQSATESAAAEVPISEAAINKMPLNRTTETSVASEENAFFNMIDDHALPMHQGDTLSMDAMAESSFIKSVLEDSVGNADAEEVKLTDTASPISPNETAPDKQLLPSILNLQMDLVGVLTLNSGVAFDLLEDSFSALYKDFDKPVYVHMQDAHKQWVLLNDVVAQELAGLININQPQKIVCSLQLADRSGAASRNMINRFQLAFETIATNINGITGGKVTWQNTGDAFSQAMALDAFCIEVDKTMFFHLMHQTSGAFTGTKLKGIAESQGMVLGHDGTFKFFDDAHPKYPEFVMFNRDNHPFNPEMLRTSVVKAITFQLDIPHTRPHASALDHMVSVAKYLEVGLNAVLVDDNNRPLGDIQIDKIRDQIKSIHATMQLRGITPGSDSAHRLFA